MIHFDHPYHIKEINIVGLGGTGSQIARTVCRIVADMRDRGLHAPDKIKFIDPDVIEEKNVGRQMFTYADVGQYKAAILGRRFSHALGLDIEWVIDPVRIGHIQYNSLVIGCVDNHEARRTLSQTNGLWIDCGNARMTGQVVIGNTDDMTRIESQMTSERTAWAHLPQPHLVLPDLLQPDLEPEPDVSCADLVQHGAQHLLVNEYVALAAGNYVSKLLHREPIYSFATFIDVEMGTIMPKLITVEDMRAYLGVLA